MEHAMSERGVDLPEDASGIGYSARDLPEGSVPRMDFVLPCGGVPSVFADNGLREVADELAMPDGASTWQAEERGWKRGKDDVFAERPRGSAAGDLQGIVAHEGGGRCHVYLNAA